MTVEELIADYEDVEDLDIVCIDCDDVGLMYEGEDIEFIDYRLLESQVTRYKYEVREHNGRTIRYLYVEC